MEFIAERIKSVDASGIRKIWQLASEMTDPVDFSIGQPDFGPSEEVKAAAISAIQQGDNGYTLTAGIEPLREKLVHQISDQFKWSNPAVIVTSGVSGAIQLAFMATINPGDEVIIPDPYFVIYKHMINMLGGKCVFADTYPDFQLRPDKIADLITEKSKLLVINSPSNPSGTVYSSDDLKAVAEIACRHNLLVVSDDIYCDFSYDGSPAHIADYYDNTIIMKGFSKAYGIPGWRLGYMALPEHLAGLFEKMAALQQYTFVCAPHPFQVAALSALESDISSHISDYRRKRDLIYMGLKDKFSLIRPAGAFYAFVPAPGGNATDFVTRAIKNNVLIIPGSIFSQRDTHFRISYATDDESIQKGIDRLCSIV